MADSEMEVVDRQRLMAICGNDNAEVYELLELAVDSASALIEELASAAESGDVVALQQLAHQLRGTAANVGASEIAELADGLEPRLAGEGATSAANGSIPELRAALIRLKNAAAEFGPAGCFSPQNLPTTLETTQARVAGWVHFTRPWGSSDPFWSDVSLSRGFNPPFQLSTIELTTCRPGARLNARSPPRAALA